MNQRRDFERYDDPRRRYVEALEGIRNLLAHFTGNPAVTEAPVTLTDLARLEGLRMEREMAYADFVKTEAQIFKT